MFGKEKKVDEEVEETLKAIDRQVKGYSQSEEPVTALITIQYTNKKDKIVNIIHLLENECYNYGCPIKIVIDTELDFDLQKTLREQKQQLTIIANKVDKVSMFAETLREIAKK